MKKIEKALQMAIEIAENPRFGYDQINRWGDDFDCSSLIIHCLEENGIPVKSKGKSTYTGNMLSGFKKCGFVEVSLDERQRGDVLLNKKHHTAWYMGDNKMVQASINEKGTTTGGKTGDQTGREIAVVDYKTPSYGWDVVLRYVEKDDEAEAPAPSETTYTVKKGDTLSKIAVKFGVTVAQLVEWNDIQNPDLINIGQVLKILSTDSPAPEYFLGKVTTERLPLNIRKGSGLDYPIIGSLPRSSTIKIAYETAGWYKLYGREGFVCAKLVTKI